MFKSILSASLMTCAFATPALATPVAMYSYLSRSSIIDIVEKTGTEVTFNSERCNGGTLGYYALRWNEAGDVTHDELGLCVDNHGNDFDELTDTLRHEAIHVAQACKGGPIVEDIEELKAAATPRIHRILTQYPADHQHVEYEAFVGAELLSDSEVVATIQKYCFS